MKSVPAEIEWAFKSLILAGAYTVFGRIALLLAIPLGYATSVFPPAGIAMAGVLIWGYRVWPGVLLGSIALNVSVKAFTFDTVQSAMFIGLASTAQALLGAWLLRRFVGIPILLDDVASVGKFVLLSGPIACLTAATFSITALAVVGSIHLDPAFYWFTWWVGDTIGVLVFLPLMLIVFGNPRQAWRKRWLSVGFPLILTFVAIASVFHFAEENRKVNSQLRFVQQTDGVQSAITQRVESCREIVHAIAGLYQSSDNVGRHEFRTFVERDFSRHPSILALGWIPRVPKVERNTIEETAHQSAMSEREPGMRQGLKEFSIKRWSPNGKWTPYGEEEANEYFPVYYLEPYEENENALGIDLASNPARRAALDKARDTGRSAATSPIMLAQETEKRFGFLIVVPIYAKGKPRETVQQRREHLAGYASGVFRMQDIVDASSPESKRVGFDLSIFDMSEQPSQRDELYGPSPRELDSQLSPEESRLQRLLPYDVGGRRWGFQFTPHEIHLSVGQSLDAWSVPTAAVFLVITVCGSLLLVAGRSETTLRDSEQRFRTMFQLAAVGITQVGPDGRFLRVNQRLCDILGYSSEELMAMTIHNLSHSHDRDANLEQVRCAIDNEQTSYAIEIRFCCKDQSVVWTNMTAALVRDEFNMPKYFVSIINDISDRREAEEQLRQEQFLLRKLIDLQETERRVVALDIHDGFTQDIIGAHMHFQNARGVLPDSQFELIDSLMRKAIAECRRMIRDLRPMILDEAGVIDAITHLVADENKHVGFNVVFQHAVQFDRLDPKLEGAIFRIVQESLNNSRRHANTDHAEVEVTQRNGDVEIVIRDQGIGFDPENVSTESFGLRGIRVRARLFGGDLRIEGGPNEGTVIRVKFPVLIDTSECRVH